MPGEMSGKPADREAERLALWNLIQQWNADRLDLFELSEPNEVSKSRKKSSGGPNRFPRGTFAQR